MSKIIKYVEHELHNFLKLLGPRAIGLKSILYEKQAKCTKINNEQLKVKGDEKAKCSIIALQEVKVGEDIECSKTIIKEVT